jgi:hypothetical protein
MKKVLIFIATLFFLIGFVSPNNVFAGAKDCLGGSFSIVYSEQCKQNGYDCSKSISGAIGTAGCHNQGGCYESGYAFTSSVLTEMCYLSAEATPPPTDCGYVGRVCCENNTCLDNAYPHFEQQPGSLVRACYCEDTPDTPNLDKNKLYCDPNGNPTTSSKTGRVYTAIGCIPLDSTNNFLAAILKWAIGIGGGIAFILIIVASFMTMTSSGNPERLKAGQELLVAAISGLILLIFSVFILKIIGIDILNLPGLNI